MKKQLEEIKYFILDMDGTIYLGDQLLEGTHSFFDDLKKSGKDFLFFTNNSSKNNKIYQEKLKGMGIEVPREKIVTSGMVTIDYLKKTYGDPTVYLLGTPMLEMDFKEAGILLTRENPDVVVAGFDTTITYEKLADACRFIRAGKPFVATHLDYNCPTEDGFIPDCGAICAFITASTGVNPKFIGKPFVETAEYLCRYLNCAKEEIAFVGDRLYTDIRIGAEHGMLSILVMTGETRQEDLEHAEFKPDIVADRLGNLFRMCSEV